MFSRRKTSTAIGTPSIPSSPIVVTTSNYQSTPSSPTKTINTTLPLNPGTSVGANATVIKYNNGSIVENDYRLEKTIGKGSYGKVKLATQLSTNEKLALKFISRASIKKPTHWTRIRREINLLRAMHHPHIVKLYDYKDNGSDILLMMEYISGGDLFDRIVHHRDQRFSEKEARPLFRQIISAVDYCHQNRIIHRDLKPENLMVDDRNQIKLIDFGFANIYSPRGYLETNCGSPLYASPEIVQGVKYVGPEVDIWSLGVILFAMLTGTLPFEDEQLKGLYAKICSGNYQAPSYLSPEARDLLKIMLTVDPKQRATMKDIKFSAWVMHGSMYPPENFMPFRQPLTRTGMTMNAVREDVIAALEDYGFTDPSATRQMVLYQADSPAYALYCLLLEREQRLAKTRAVKSSNVGLFPLTSVSSTTSTTTTTAAAVNTVIPMQNIAILQDETDSLLDSPASANTCKATRITPPSPSSGSNLVAQAAAHVASRFRKLRDLNFGRTQATSIATVDSDIPSVDSMSIPRSTITAPYSIAVPITNPHVQVHNYYSSNHQAPAPVISTSLHVNPPHSPQSIRNPHQSHPQGPQSYQDYPRNPRAYNPQNFM
jgi:serine/threonine protein kinase